MKYDEMLNGGLDLGMTLNTMEGKKFEKIGEESTKRRNYIGESDVASLRTGRSSETPLSR